MSALRRRGAGEMPTFHMVELLDASLRGLTRDELLQGRRTLAVGGDADAAVLPLAGTAHQSRAN